MPSLYEILDRPELDSPVLIVALDGWVDAGLAGASALERIVAETELATVATFDADLLLDHRARRPTLHLVDGRNTGLTWPVIELRAAADGEGRDLLVLTGAEPDHLWRAFSRAVVDLALEFGVRLVVSLGAYPSPTPHTRPSRVVSTATTEELAELVGYLPGSIDVPAGVSSAIERRCADVGLPSVGLWAQVPHYAAAMPYPAGAVALVEMLAIVTGLDVGPGPLVEDAARTRARIDSLIAGNPEHEQMVQQLEVQLDATANDEFEISGEQLAAEVEQFLRDERD